MKAIAVADSNCAQWFTPHLLRSLPMRTVIPADEHAAENVRVDVTASPKVNKPTIEQFRKLRLTNKAYASTTANEKLHKHCKPTAATRYRNAVTEGKSLVVAITQRETAANMN